MSITAENEVCRRTIMVRSEDRPEREITIRFAKPVAVLDGSDWQREFDWQCEFGFFEQDGSIATLATGQPAIGNAHGVDGVQALSLAMQGARAMLDCANITISYLDVPDQTAGIARAIAGFTPAMTRHLEALVEEGMAKIAERLANPETRSDVRDEFELWPLRNPERRRGPETL